MNTGLTKERVIQNLKSAGLYDSSTGKAKSSSSSTPVVSSTPTTVDTGASSAASLAAKNNIGSSNVSANGQYATPSGSAVDTSQPSPQSVRDQAIGNLQKQGYASPDEGEIQGAMSEISSSSQGGVASPYLQTYQNLQGKNVPNEAGLARGMVADATPTQTQDQSQGNAIIESLFQQDPVIDQVLKNLDSYMSPENQGQTLVKQYQSMLKASGLNEINTEMLNTKKIIDGTEDDIRAEVTAAGGFATDSQVLALANARNKTLIQNYNNLLATRDSIQQQLSTMVNLASQDRQFAQSQMNQRLNIEQMILNYRDKFQSNARESLNNIVQNVGYGGLYEQVKNDPYSQSLVEKSLGLAQGGLSALATYKKPLSESEQLDMRYKEAQIAKINSEISGSNSTDPTLALAYAQQYASTGQIPTGLPKGTFGVVAEMAKSLPQVDGAVVDRNTGVKSGKVSAEQQGGYATMYSVVELAKQLKELDQQRWGGIIAGTAGKIFGSEDQAKYINLKDQIADLLARARTGAAINASEEARYYGLLPGRFSEPFGLGTDSQKRIQNFIDVITSDLDNKTRSQGLAIYGLSTVDIGGQSYTVGSIVENADGQKGRINSDGTITQY